MQNVRYLTRLAAVVLTVLTPEVSLKAAETLEDVSVEAGLADLMPVGGMKVDFDRDGALDLVLATREVPSLIVYRNIQGSGPTRFEEAGVTFNPEHEGISTAAWGDFDEDGDLDLFTSTRYGTSRLYRNNGSDFEDVAASMGLKNDGALDAAWGDYDTDGDLDLIVGRVADLRLFRNDRTNFVDVTGGVGLSNITIVSDVDWVDFDNDGRLDLWCAGPRSVNRLFQNLGAIGPGGSWEFVDVAPDAGIAESHTTRMGAWGDYDNDGDQDLYLVNGHGPNRLLRYGNSVFEDVSQIGVDDEESGIGATWIDFDSDADLDLYLVNLLGPDRLFRNDVDRFTDISGSLGIGGREVVNGVWGDFDRDGVPDLFEARVGSLRLFRGKANQNGSLNLRVGDPAGARVTVNSNGIRQVRELQDGMALFGLGPQSGTEIVTVIWPDGSRITRYREPGTKIMQIARDDRLPTLDVDAKDLVFGKVEFAAKSSSVILNRGEAPMTLRTAGVNHPAFRVEVDLPQVIQPGESLVLPVHFSPGKPGLQTGILTVQTDDPWHGQGSIPLSATAVVPDISTSVEQVDFGPTPVGKSTSSEIAIFNRGVRTLTLSSVSTEGPFEVEGSPSMTVAPGESQTLSIGFNPFAVGPATGSLFILSDDPDRHETSLVLEGRGRGTPVVVLSSPELDFGGVLVGNAHAMPLTVSNEGDDDLTVGHISVSNPFGAPDKPFVLGPGELTELEVLFKPLQPGDVLKTLTLTTDEETPFLGDPSLNPPHILKNDVVTFGSARPTSTGPVPGGSGLLGLLTFRPTDGFTPDRTTALRVEGVSLRNPSGNSEIGESVVLTIQRGKFGILRGDINEDGSIDLADFFLLGQGFGLHEADPDFDGRLDLNGDGIIGLEDLFIFQDGMGKK